MECDGLHPMPWPWSLCRHCLDLQTGTVHQWPLPGGWLRNEPLLEAMIHIWRIAQLYATPIDQWTSEDVALDEWVQDGRPALAQPLTDYERWLANLGNDD